MWLLLLGMPTSPVTFGATFTVNSTIDAANISPGDGVFATADGLCTNIAVVLLPLVGGLDSLFLMGTERSYRLSIAFL